MLQNYGYWLITSSAYVHVQQCYVHM